MKTIYSAILYFAWLFVEIIKSSLAVSKILWSRDVEISPTIAMITNDQENNWLKLLYANSITLTPGTITLSLDGKTMVVHSLTKSGIKDLLSGRMANQCAIITRKCN